MSEPAKIAVVYYGATGNARRQGAFAVHRPSSMSFAKSTKL